MDVELSALDAAGDLVLDLNSGGYKVLRMSTSGQTWRRLTSTSPNVDGDSPSGPDTLESQTHEVSVKITGTSWAQVMERLDALVDAVTSSPRWVLLIGIEGYGERWRASRADWVSPRRTSDVMNKSRVVNLSIPCQPTATITLPEAP